MRPIAIYCNEPAVNRSTIPIDLLPMQLLSQTLASELLCYISTSNDFLPSASHGGAVVPTISSGELCGDVDFLHNAFFSNHATCFPIGVASQPGTRRSLMPYWLQSLFNEYSQMVLLPSCGGSNGSQLNNSSRTQNIQ
jgi:hypothetical protein